MDLFEAASYGMLPVHLVCVWLMLYMKDQTAHRYARLAYPAHLGVFSLVAAVWVVLYYYVQCDRSISEFLQIKHAGVAFLLVGLCTVIMHLLLRIITMLRTFDTNVVRHVFSLDKHGKLLWGFMQGFVTLLLFSTVFILYSQDTVCH